MAILVESKWIWWVGARLGDNNSINSSELKRDYSHWIATECELKTEIEVERFALENL